MKKGSAVRNFLDIFGGTFLTLAIGVLTTPIITRIVDPNDYGQWALFTMYANIAMMVLGLGLDQSLIRYYYKVESHEYKRSLLSKCIYLPIVTIVVLSILLILFKGVIEKYLNISSIVLILFCIHLLGLLLNRFSILVLRLQYKTKAYAILNVMYKISYVGIAFILISSVKKEFFLLLSIATVISNLVVTLCAIAFERNLWTIKKNKEKFKLKFKELLIYGAPFILSNGITILFQGVDKISLSYYCTLDEVGIYSSAMTIINIFAIIQTSFNALWAPMAMEHYEKFPEDKTFYYKGNQIITVIMFVAGSGLILCKEIFALLLGKQYQMAAYILPFLIFSPIMYTISETTVCGISFAKKSIYNVFIALGACICNIVGNFIFVPVFGSRGAAISTGIAYIVFFTLRTILSNKFFYIDFKLGKFYLVTLILVVYSFYNTTNPFNYTSIIGFIIFNIIVYILYREIIYEILRYGIKSVKQYLNRKAYI